MNSHVSALLTRASSRLFQFLPVLLAALFMLASTSVWAGVPPPSSVTFDGFNDPNSIFRIEQQCRTPVNFEDPPGSSDWEEWCYLITSEQSTSSEFSHFGVELDPSQHMNSSTVQNFIESTMSVTPNDSEYYPQEFTWGGPLNNLSGGRVQWNNQYDNVTGQDESALFCFSAPTIPIGPATVGLKVGGDRRSATLQASADSGVAVFDVNKNFSDDNPLGVEVHIRCNNGLPLEQSTVIKEGSGVIFVVETFDTGPMDCQIWETEVDGYTVGYEADITGTATSEGCFFEDVDACGLKTCDIDNTLEAVEFEVTKEWVAFDELVDIDQDVKIGLFCENIRATPEGDLFNDEQWVILYDGTPSYAMHPYPNYGTPASRCRAQEYVFDDAVESDQGCTNWLTFTPGDSGISCVITNTVFFEGIPTLNRYGLAIMALLMLGLGVLGFRRFI